MTIGKATMAKLAVAKPRQRSEEPRPQSKKSRPRSAKTPEERNQRGETTRHMLLDAAERVIAERGVDSVSMRQIGAAVGQGNIAVIQYYFENKEGLVSAIIEHRAEEMERVRHAMLEDAKKTGKTSDARSLLAILNLPMAKIKDEKGRSVYAAFLLQGLKVLWRDGVTIQHTSWSQSVQEILDLLAQLRPDLTKDQLTFRVLQVNRLFVNAVVDRDRIRDVSDLQESDEFFFEDMLNMMSAAFNAPRPQIKTASTKPHQQRNAKKGKA